MNKLLVLDELYKQIIWGIMSDLGEQNQQQNKRM